MPSSSSNQRFADLHPSNSKWFGPTHSPKSSPRVIDPASSLTHPQPTPSDQEIDLLFSTNIPSSPSLEALLGATATTRDTSSPLTQPNSPTQPEPNEVLRSTLPTSSSQFSINAARVTAVPPARMSQSTKARNKRRLLRQNNHALVVMILKQRNT